jgi:tetratricopeptide (TPR) repeat protein
MRVVLIILQAALILLLGYWVATPALRGEWLFDDAPAVLYNPVMHRATGLWTIWFAPPGPDYFPLKDSVQWIQWHLFGSTTHGYHLTNIALHLISALLIWRLLYDLGVRLAWLGGLAFAVHPCAVESVAWICELKNTLSLPLLLVAMLAYLRHERQGDLPSYFTSAVAFLASLLCKTSGVMFPVVILLYAWWRHGQIRAQDWKKSVPFFVISLTLGLVTIAFQQHVPPGGEAIESLDPLSRFLCAGLSIAFYISKVFLPIDLTIVYYRWDVHAAVGWEILCWGLIVASVAWLATRRGTWARHALFGYLFFLINLLPVLGFIRLTWTHYAWVANHFLYLPMIGLIAVAVAAVGDAYRRHAEARVFISVAVAVATLLFSVQSYNDTTAFKSSFFLWSTNLNLNPQSWLGRNNLAVTLAAHDFPAEAIRQLELSLQTNPNQALAYINWGNALTQMGRIPEAIDAYHKALALRPDNPLAHYQAGHAFAQEEHWDEAIGEYQAALRFNPDDVAAHSDLAAVLMQTGRGPEAIAEARKAIALDPAYADAHYNLGLALAQGSDLRGAIVEFEAAARLNPDDAPTQYNLGIAYLQAGRNDDALRQFQKALKLNPSYAAARSQIERLEGVGR